MEQRAFEIANVEMRSASDDQQPKLSGYFIEWEKLSDPIYGMFQEKFAQGAFRNLDGDIRALWQHDSSRVLGRTTNGTLTITEDKRGAKFEIIPDPEISWHQDAMRSIQRGDVTEMSFMFRCTKDMWDVSDPAMAIRTVLEADLYEVSPVTFPAYPQTSVGVRSAQEVFDSYKASLPDEVPDLSKSLDIRKKRLELLSKL